MLMRVLCWLFKIEMEYENDKNKLKRYNLMSEYKMEGNIKI